jgi:hypothetical protein
MADEANTPNHRYYKPENNILLQPDAHIAALAAQRGE